MIGERLISEYAGACEMACEGNKVAKAVGQLRSLSPDVRNAVLCKLSARSSSAIAQFDESEPTNQYFPSVKDAEIRLLARRIGGGEVDEASTKTARRMLGVDQPAAANTGGRYCPDFWATKQRIADRECV